MAIKPITNPATGGAARLDRDAVARVGRSVPRNVYWRDVPLFVAASPELAAEIVEALNRGTALDPDPQPQATSEGVLEAPHDTSRMAEGCCSACSPCSHQKRDPYSICDVCQKAAAIGAERERASEHQRAVAKAAAERAGKNASVAPELLFAPILWALQDAAITPAGRGTDVSQRKPGGK